MIQAQSFFYSIVSFLLDFIVKCFFFHSITFSSFYFHEIIVELHNFLFFNLVPKINYFLIDQIFLLLVLDGDVLYFFQLALLSCIRAYSLLFHLEKYMFQMF